MKYRTIVADPPWPYSAADGGNLRASKEHRPNSHNSKLNGPGVQSRYAVISIAGLKGLAVEHVAAADAHLYLWTTNAFMYAAHQVAWAWGFKTKTICTWGKIKPNGTPSMKMGHWFRGATEHCLFCIRGSLSPTTTVAIPTLWLWPRGPHSVKPGAFYDLVQTMSPGPYLELFARSQRLGWDTWGNEALQHVQLGEAP